MCISIVNTRAVCFAPIDLANLTIFSVGCRVSHFVVTCKMSMRISSNIFASIVATVPCCVLENCCWDYMLVSSRLIFGEADEQFSLYKESMCVIHSKNLHHYQGG